jgi:putative transcriptional regulator
MKSRVFQLLTLLELSSCDSRVIWTGLMFLNWLSRLIFVLTAIAVPAPFLNAAQPCRAQTSVHVSLAGQLLIASPMLRDSNFDHAVILVVRHNESGAMGIVINMPGEERPLANILEMLGEKDTNVTGKVQLFAGGPVQPEVGFVIHSSDYRGPATIDVNERVLATSTIQILRDIGNNKGPKKSLVAFGYAGWAAYQLEDELRRRVWLTAPADLDLIFDESREKLWDSAYARRAQDL